MGERITIRRPDDWHTHLRENEMLKWVLPYSNVFGRVVAIGNLNRPIVDAYDVKKYRMEILRQKPRFQPVMSIMLVKQTTPQIICRAFEEGARVLKFIPADTSTGSQEGISLINLKDYYPVLEMAERLVMIFSGHWELTKDPETARVIPELEREEAALPYLKKVIDDFPNLKIVVEHVSTAKMIYFIEKAPANVAATLTAHHIGPAYYPNVFNEKGEIEEPFYYCRPVIKNIKDADAVMRAMTSGNPKFFFGSDSAPHPIEKKLKNPPAAGIFSAPVALVWVWTAFQHRNNGKELFENFISRSGAEFYGLPLNNNYLTLVKQKWTVPKTYNGIVPFLAGFKLYWQIAEQ
ncbi:MAG: hypothetical protein V1892_02085 [bacterium]